VLKRRYRIIIPILLLFCLFGGGFSSLATEAPEPVAFVELSNLSYPVAGESPDFEVSVSGAKNSALKLIAAAPIMGLNKIPNKG